MENFFRERRLSAMKSLGEKQEILKSHGNKELEIYLECGATMHFAYPFMPAKYLSRQEDIVESSKALFRAASSNCGLSRSSVSNSKLAGIMSSDSLGVFATSDITASERLLEDTTSFAVTSISASAPSTLPTEGTPLIICDNCCGYTRRATNFSLACCQIIYCSQQCRDLALSYHKVLCGKNFDWLYNEAKKLPTESSLNGPMWLRVLATCVQSGIHPLDHPMIARLTPLYSRNGRKWSLVSNIKHPILILKQLGINPFKDLRFDTWVLQTLWARIITNQGEHPLSAFFSLLEPPPQGLRQEKAAGTWDIALSVRSISPLYSFFNHSCENNADFECDRGSALNGGTKTFFAKQNIKKGEEICVSYVHFKGNETKEERRVMLAPWIGMEGRCGCSKCRRET